MGRTLMQAYYLLGIIRSNRWCVVDLDATPLLVLAVVERQLPAALLLRCAQPQPHQVPTGRWRWVVLVCRPSMEDMVVGEELDITNIQDHVKSKAQAGLVEDASSANLLRRERRNETLVAETGQGLDVVWVPPEHVRTATD